MQNLMSVLKRAATAALGVLAFFASVNALADEPPVIQTVKSGWVPLNEWMDVCACESWDDVKAIQAHTAGSAMQPDNITLTFAYADGICRLVEEKQAKLIARWDDVGVLGVQFQTKSDYIKCPKIAFKVENGRLWAKGVYARYTSKDKDYPYDFDKNSYNGGSYGSGGYCVDKLTVSVLDASGSLTVDAVPEQYGSVTPAYGRTFGYAEGDLITPVSAPASWESDDHSQSAACTGWKLYSRAEYGGEWQFVREGTSLEPTDLVHPGVATKLVWQWAPTIACTASSNGHGTVSPESASVPYGGTFTVTATPADGYFFAAWSGVPDAQRCDNPITQTVTESLNLTATFLPVGSEAEWTGAGDDALASNPQNWEAGVAPLPGQGVLVTGDKSMTWDIAYPVGSWTQRDYSGTVTFNTIYEGAKATGFPCLVVGGDVTLESGAWTHRANGQTKLYRLNVKVGGNMTIGPGATIHADGRGYDKCIAIDGKYPNAGNVAGSYGGHGGFGNGDMNYTYGSYSAPEDPGNGGYWNSYSLPAGGAIRLEVAGTLTHQGAIRANSTGTQSYYSGSGGGIYIIAGAMSGNGTIKANAYGNEKCGGGGRIAVKLTGKDADFSEYDLVHLAEAIPLKVAANSGSPGTIYGETAADEPGQGWLVMKGNGTVADVCECSYADPFTFETKELHFARMTFTNNVMMRVYAGCTLDLRGTEVVAADVSGRTNGIRLNGGTLVWPEGEESEAEIACRIQCVTAPVIPSEKIVAKPYGNLLLNTAWSWAGDVVLDGGQVTAQKDFILTGDMTAKTKGVFCSDAKTTVSGNVVVEAGGRLTTEGPTQKESDMRRLELAVSGDLTIAEGGAVDVTGKGFQNNYSPIGYIMGNGGRSHGGVGFLNQTGSPESAVKCYGSIYAPAQAGAGSSHVAGGGVLALTVAGTLTNDGAIAARGADGAYRGAGGSIRITAGELVGSGTVDASSNPTSGAGAGYSGCSGGGRIAVTLTGEGADFSAFPMERFLATGDRCGTAASGAGTIYLRTAADAADEGTLILRNLDAATNWTRETPLADGIVQGTAFGTVIITNRAHAKLATSGKITVKGDWLNFATFEAGAGSTVDFAGAAPCRIAGNTTFAILSSSAAGKVIAVDAGTTVKVTEICNLGGTVDAPVELGSSEGTWTLDNAGATTMVGVKLSGCQATHPFTVVNGVDGGNNSDNVTFITITPGETITWEGGEDGAWGNAANWDRKRAPISSDNVVVAKGANAPALEVGVAVASLTVEDGAALDVGSRSMAVTGDFVSQGALRAAAGGSLAVGGTATVVGAAALAGSELVLNGAAAQTLTAGSGVKFGSVKVLSPALTIPNSVTCDAFTVGDGAAARTVTFAAGISLKATDFTVIGAEGRLVTLAGADGATWNLGVSRASVAFAAVSGSDASKGVLILPTNSTDGGGNVNWMFSDTRVHWDGTSATTADDDVVIDAGKTYTIDAAREMKSLTVAGGAKLTVNAALDVAGSVTVEGDATLVWNRPGTIGGNLTVLSGGTLTHDANSDKELNKISLDIAGSGYIQDGAQVTGRGNGYTSGKGPGSVGGNTGGSHGGRGYLGSGTAAACYGSILCPTNCGSGGGTGRTTRAGGAVRLAFGEELTMDGTIDVNGRDESSDGYYTGAGGSVWVTAKSLAGGGTITADGGAGTMQKQGGGGRIALWLTGAGEDFSGFSGTVHAWGGLNNVLVADGSAGTVFRKTADDIGTLFIGNNPSLEFRKDYDMTDFPSSRLCDTDEALGINVELSNRATLNLMQDYRINSLKVSGTTPRIKLNGHLLRVATPVRKSEREAILARVTDGAPGQIIWPKGTLILLK